MKYAIRRAIVGVVSIPLIAGAYTFLYLLLLVAGAEPGQTLAETFNFGVVIGITSAIFLTFYPQFSRFLDRLIDNA